MLHADVKIRLSNWNSVRYVVQDSENAKRKG